MEVRRVIIIILRVTSSIGLDEIIGSSSSLKVDINIVSIY